MQTLYNGVEVFTNGDSYNLADDVAHAFSTANVLIAVSSLAQRNGLAAIAPDGILPPGTTVVRKDITGFPLETWDGVVWRPRSWTFAEYGNSALVNSPVPANGQLGPFYQSFPAGRFTVAPLVTLGTSNARLTASWNNVTTSGFDLYIRNDTPVEAVTGAIITFTAKQMTPTTAAG